ncbi:hypothetical protein [Paenibacillus kribbensis]|nr:hypothetical protein [Paenibacillus kribbensis]
MVIENNELELIETLNKASGSGIEGIVVANITGLVSRYKNMITLKVAI